MPQAVGTAVACVHLCTRQSCFREMRSTQLLMCVFHSTWHGFCSPPPLLAAQQIPGRMRKQQSKMRTFVGFGFLAFLVTWACLVIKFMLRGRGQDLVRQQCTRFDPSLTRDLPSLKVLFY